MMKLTLSTFLALTLTAISARAQSIFFAEDFDGVTAGTFPSGWSADAPTGTPATGWAVDDTLDMNGGTIPTGPPFVGTYPYIGWNWSCYGSPLLPVSTINSAPNALNFNNGLGLLSGTLAIGSATSPLITLTSTAGVTLTFADYFESMSCDADSSTATSFGLDQRFVEVLDSTGVVVISIQLVVDFDGDGLAPFTASSPLIDAACVDTETIHFHTVDLSSLTPGDYRVRFRFNQVLEFDFTIFATTPPFNEDDLGGWFIDDVQMNCPLPDVTAPTACVLGAPLPGATVISPVTFTWSLSTDTGPCGPGTVFYDLLIDDPLTLPFPDFSQLGLTVLTGVQALPPGVYDWGVLAYDASGNFTLTGPNSFTVEVNLQPDLADTLHVNESIDGSQNGEPGFVDPVADESPVFSAIYRDPNVTPDLAVGLRFQVSLDPTFATIDFDSGPVGISPPLPVGTRCPDLTVNISLLRDTVYFWRIQFTDAGGLTSFFSLAQSFRIGDDFEFGVRHGSTHHGRRCWVATAAWSSESAPAVASLQSWRFGTLENSAAGQVASRSYHVVGARTASVIGSSSLARTATSGFTGFSAGLAAVAALALVLLGVARLSRPS